MLRNLKIIEQKPDVDPPVLIFFVISISKTAILQSFDTALLCKCVTHNTMHEKQTTSLPHVKHAKELGSA